VRPAPLSEAQLQSSVEKAVAEQPVIDIHTHLYPPSFGTPAANRTARTDPTGLMLWGIDELLTYHYLVAEVYRVVPASELPYEQFWALSKREQADHIWKHLFQLRTPLSEACRGVVTTLNRLGLDPAAESLDGIRAFFAEQDPDAYLERVMELATVERITMTNNIFDDNEHNRWLANPSVGADSRFCAVLRIDPMLTDWRATWQRLREWGYETEPEMTMRSVHEGRRFLRDWLGRMNAAYVAASLPPTFRYPAADPGIRVLEQIVLPVCQERGIAMALMIGSRRSINPGLHDGGDMVGKGDPASVAALCAAHPGNRFLVTTLAREDQHELAVAAHKFGSLTPFGCWWFLNNPSLVDEITRMRVEMLGTSFIPQHSDARVLDQLIYKWDHGRQAIAAVLTDKYRDLIRAGWPVTQEGIEADCRLFLRDNAADFLSP